MKGDEGRAFGGERRGRYEGKGTSGPRGMNQAEQTLNFEIRYRRTKATHHWRPNRGYARGTPWPITILHSPVTPPRAASLSGNWPPPPSRQLENSIYTYIYIYTWQILVVERYGGDVFARGGRRRGMQKFQPLSFELVTWSVVRRRSRRRNFK